jgi:hypothetical protein
MLKHTKIHGSTVSPVSSNDAAADTPVPRDLFEIKYSAPVRSRSRILTALRHYARTPDRFSYARMRTTYFDDRSGASLREALDGELNKKKYRMREYLDTSEGASYSVEVKIRAHTVTRKIKRLVFEKLPQGFRPASFRELLSTFEKLTGSTLTPLRLELPPVELFPDAVIIYERHRFDDYREDTRYNMDTNILVCPGITAGGGRGAQGFSLDNDVFEIKTPRVGFFPEFLKGMGLVHGSFSKFVWGKVTVGQ